MALLMREDFPDVDIDRVVKMCLIHDFGEAITGDIPSFLKSDADEVKEQRAITQLLSLLPQEYADEFALLFIEMSSLSTSEAKLFKALDNMEAIISHNEAPLSTWLPLEYKENLIYGANNVAFSEYLKKLKEEINVDSLKKIKAGI
jgi:putative hydrolase of HD superfamily